MALPSHAWTVKGTRRTQPSRPHCTPNCTSSPPRSAILRRAPSSSPTISSQPRRASARGPGLSPRQVMGNTSPEARAATKSLREIRRAIATVKYIRRAIMDESSTLAQFTTLACIAHSKLNSKTTNIFPRPDDIPPHLLATADPQQQVPPSPAGRPISDQSEENQETIRISLKMQCDKYSAQMLDRSWLIRQMKAL